MDTNIQDLVRATRLLRKAEVAYLRTKSIGHLGDLKKHGIEVDRLLAQFPADEVPQQGKLPLL